MAAVGHHLSQSVTKITLFFNELELATATGFFVRYREGWALATNWHVLSGRFPDTGQPRRDDGCVPNLCKYQIFDRYGEKFVSLTKWERLGDICCDDATWLEHPLQGQNVDIAILPLSDSYVGLAKDFFDPTGFDPDFFVDIGAELFIPGYPQGLEGPGGLSLWKRASLASTLEIGEGIKEYCLVDTATREGMSGAPCIAMSNWRHYRIDRSTGKMSVIERPLSWNIIGVYAGRFNPSDSFEAQIGRVWRVNGLLDIIDRGAMPSLRLT